MKENETLRDIIAPSVDARVKVRTKINDYAYYAIIVIVTMLVMFIPPLLIGSVRGDIGMLFPKDVTGWVLWGIINGSTAIGNMSILVLFKLQAKKNCRNNANFIRANEILQECTREKQIFIPRSPRSMNRKEYFSKGLFIVIGSVTSFTTISAILLSFDIVTLISTVISATTSLCVSWATMVKNEEYWCEEYLLYAEYIKKKLYPETEEKEAEDGSTGQDVLPEHAAADREEQTMDRGSDGRA